MDKLFRLTLCTSRKPFSNSSVHGEKMTKMETTWRIGKEMGSFLNTGKTEVSQE